MNAMLDIALALVWMVVGGLVTLAIRLKRQQQQVDQDALIEQFVLGFDTAAAIARVARVSRGEPRPLALGRAWRYCVDTGAARLVDAPSRYAEVWDASDPAPGRMVCGDCGVPVEDEPCKVHGPAGQETAR